MAVCESLPLTPTSHNCLASHFPEDLLLSIGRCGVIAVLVVDDPSQAVLLSRALLAGGINVIELTLRTPAALDSLRAIRSEVYEMTVGVGTVLFPNQVKEAVDAGAHFAVSPGINPEVVGAARSVGLPFAPGIATPSDLEVAIKLGCREVKLFPAEPLGGLKYLQCIKAPYAHLGIKYIPLGGLNVTNMASYLSDPDVLAIGGSWIAPSQLIRDGDWDGISSAAAEASSNVSLCKESCHE